jgi:hypothetical protein
MYATLEAGGANFSGFRHDFAAKSREMPQKVIRAQKEVHSFVVVKYTWISCFKGMTTFCNDN